MNRIPGYIRKSFFQVESISNRSKSELGQVSEDHLDEVLEVADEQRNENEALGILDVDFHIHTGFQLSTLAGPLCAEPVQGVCYIVQGVEIRKEETDAQKKDGKCLMYMCYFDGLTGSCLC